MASKRHERDELAFVTLAATARDHARRLRRTWLPDRTSADLLDRLADALVAPRAVVVPDDATEADVQAARDRFASWPTGIVWWPSSDAEELADLLREVIGDDDPRTYDTADQWRETLSTPDGEPLPDDAHVEVVVHAGTLRRILDAVRGPAWGD